MDDELGFCCGQDAVQLLCSEATTEVTHELIKEEKMVKRQKYQCVNLAGRAFTTYLEDIPAKMIWEDGRVAEVYKEDKLYTVLNEITRHILNVKPASFRSENWRVLVRVGRFELPAS